MIRLVTLFVLISGIFVHAQSTEKYFTGLFQRVAQTGESVRAGFKAPRIFNRREYSDSLYRLRDHRYPASLTSREQTFLRLMGFADKKFSLPGARVRLIKNGAEGFYNSADRELNLPSGKVPVDDIAALEVARGYRKQIVDSMAGISLKLKERSLFDDRWFALNTWFEADSIFLMVKYGEMFTVFPFDANLMTSIAETDSLMTYTSLGSYTSLYSYPDVVRYQVRAPFIEGIRFVYSIFSRKKKKNWQRVNEIIKRPPISSEQILHPAKYIKNELPVDVKISYKPEGYEMYHEGVLGEFYINVMLCDNSELTGIATNWGGDQYRVYRKENSEFLIWKSEWDNPKAASFFLRVFSTHLGSKYGMVLKKGSRNGRSFLGGRSEGYYYFLYFSGKVLYYVKTNNRKDINKFINGGNYD